MRRVTHVVAALAVFAAGLAATTAHAASAAGNGRIAFVSTRDGFPNLEIYSMAPDGSDQVNLTNDAGRDSEPAWSPDGSRLAFVSDRAGAEQIYVMNADGTNPVQLTADPSGNSSPAWSPDGAQIAFASSRTGEGAIFVMNADGSNQTQLVADAAGDGNPDWSPDGTRIAFDRIGSEHGCEIYVIDVVGTNLRNLTDREDCDSDPAWSPDGSQIAFRSLRDTNSEIYVVAADGTNPRRLTRNTVEETAPRWSPDGTQIVFARCCPSGDSDVLVMRTDGTTVINRSASPGQDGEPAWQSIAPSAIASPSATPAGAPSAAVVPASSPQTASTTADAPAVPTMPIWSPAYMGDRGVATRDQAISVAQRFPIVAAAARTYQPWVGDMMAANPALQLTGYSNAMMVSKNDALSYPQSWYAHDVDGNRIESTAYGSYLMDASVAGWQDASADRCAAVMATSGYSGCLLDVLGPAPLSVGYVTSAAVLPGTQTRWTKGPWLQANADLANHIRSRVSPGIVLGNGISRGSNYFDATAPTSTLLNGLDGGMIEAFVRGPREPIGSFRSEADWRRDVDMLVDIENRQSVALAVTKTWTAANDDQRRAVHKYVLASFLLGAGSRSHLSFIPDESPGAPTGDDPLWHVDLGTPTGAYVPVSGVYRRNYSKGVVVVNPTTSVHTLALGGNYVDTSGRTMSSVTLQPHQAELFTPSTVSAASVVVSDSGFTPAAYRAARGATVRWRFDGPGVHSVADSSGMALFDSGQLVAGSSFSYAFNAAGTYPYMCRQHSTAGTVSVPISASPASGTRTTVTTLTWASATAPAGYVFDIQVRRPGSTAFVAWRTAQTVASGTFTADAGTGTYSFRSRLRRTDVVKSSRWSPLLPYRVS